MARGKAGRDRSDNFSWSAVRQSSRAVSVKFHLSSRSQTRARRPNQLRSSRPRTVIRRTCTLWRVVECSGCRRWGMSTALRYFLPSGGAPLIEVLASARPRTSWRPGTIIGRRSVVEVACRSRIAWGTLRQVLCCWQVLPPQIQPAATRVHARRK